MAQENGKSGKFRSILSDVQGASNAPVFSNLVVPTGCIFRGFVTGLVRNGAIAEQFPIMNLQKGGNAYVFLSPESGGAVAGTDYSFCEEVILDAGTWSSAWEVLPSAGGTNRIAIMGVIEYL